MSCGCVMCLSAMVMESAFRVVVRWPLKALKIFQRWESGVKRLKVLMNSAQDSRFAFLMTFRHSAFAFLYRRRLSCVLCLWNLFFRVFLYLTMFLHSSFHHGAALGLLWKVRVCGMCCVAASSMISVN